MRGLPRRWLCALFVPVCWSFAFAQSPGLPPEWEVRDSLTSLAEQVGRLKPILQEVNPEDWSRKGAPEAYQAQWKSIAAEIEYLMRSTKELSDQPERLTLALETLLRMQALESMLASINEGIRRYQNPALADLLRGVMSDNAVHREKLRQYVVQLAEVKEHELKVMHEEAQRCRASLSRQPPARSNARTTAEPK